MVGRHWLWFPLKHSFSQLPGLWSADSWVFPHVLSSAEGSCLAQEYDSLMWGHNLGSAGDISDKPSQLQSSLRTWLNPSLPHFPLSRAASLTPLQVPFLRVLLSSLPSLTVLFLGNLSQRLSIHPLGFRSHFTTPHGTFPASRKTVLSLVSLTNARHLHRTLSSLRAGSSPDIQL